MSVRSFFSGGPLGTPGGPDILRRVRQNEGSSRCLRMRSRWALSARTPGWRDTTIACGLCFFEPRPLLRATPGASCWKWEPRAPVRSPAVCLLPRELTALAHLARGTSGPLCLCEEGRVHLRLVPGVRGRPCPPEVAAWLPSTAAPLSRRIEKGLRSRW